MASLFYRIVAGKHRIPKTSASELEEVQCSKFPAVLFKTLTTEIQMTNESSGTNFGDKVFKFCANAINVVVICI
jgi:hypothetical protein